MKLPGLLPLLKRSALYEQWLAGLQSDGLGGRHSLPLLRAARPYLLAALATDLDKALVIITSRPERAAALLETLCVYLGDAARVMRFAEPGSLPYERAPWPREAVCDRLRVLAALAGLEAAGRPKPIVIASASACMQRTLPPRLFRSSARTLKRGQMANLSATLLHWINIGYERANVVESPGQFCNRGGIADVFSPASPYPVRIEFFGDEIESLRQFDPATQRSLDVLQETVVTPASEALPRFGPHAAGYLHGWNVQGLPEDVRQAYVQDLAALASGEPFRGIEFYLPCFYDELAGLLDYVPPDKGLIVLDEPGEIEDTWHELEEQAVDSREKTAAPAGQAALPPAYPLPYLTWDDWREAVGRQATLALGEQETFDAERQPLSEAFVPGPRFGGQIKPVLDHLAQCRAAGETIVVASRQVERLAELWGERDFYQRPVTALDEAPHGLVFVSGALPDGWTARLPAGAERLFTLHLLSDGEIFGWVRPVPRRRIRPRAIAPESYLADMQPGDYVVHVEHGVGIFQGLTSLTVDGVEREYLDVLYAAGDKLYVPIHQADRLSRYIGADERPPAVHRLGTADWSQVKKRAQAATLEVAKELLELYAARETVAGHAFSPDAAWQRELEASFPYYETEDQMRAIREVKADMERVRPMDRLICGDVGYGKTEVALRAAFKAIQDGKQVAMLVPTTILAQQHYTTFSQRLATYPVNVEMLSRFRSRAEQGKILASLESGQVDIVIGTHRLLQQDVRFKDLGLLIIDEEQRFGVTHKERLKHMRTEVDVLTMTATPIPRTMYMSLVGVRDISTIETPPEERLPVFTYVGQYNDSLVRTAILRELDRGGQVYFVHNRVQGIEQVKRRLEAVVPEARLAIGHGQMPEDRLEHVMVEFVSGRVDVLLSTSIIESGMDIPNANTLIVNRADQFGLAQLYQLRGRVGRSAVRAYAYFLYDHAAHLTPEARQRLETIREASELGAGFSIAMRDLEIRGAGDLLGVRQHGHISAVGFELYTRLLARSVEELRAARRGEPPPPPMVSSVTIDLPLAAYLPAAYVPEEKLRLQVYRRLANLDRPDSVDEIEQEMLDRFGPLPKPAADLLFQLRLKLLAQQAGVTTISFSGEQIVLKADWLDTAERAGLQMRLAEQAYVSRRQINVPRRPGHDWRAALTAVLDVLRNRQAA